MLSVLCFTDLKFHLILIIALVSKENQHHCPHLTNKETHLQRQSNQGLQHRSDY